MPDYLVDSNVLLDLFYDDPDWADWSEQTLERCARRGSLYINPVIYSEISIGFKHIEALESALRQSGLEMLDIPREALFLAGKAFLKYRRRSGPKRSPLPDFYIGAHTAVAKMQLITRDTGRYKTAYPKLKIICPS
jgi:predicted nucleic acid-binding protein